MDRPPESLKPFANRIAHAAVPEKAAQIVRLLRLSGLLSGPAENLAPTVPAPIAHAPDPCLPPTESKHVGIWERRTENGRTCFVRRLEMMDEWHFWSNLARIEPKGPRRRVLLMGESVARGYLYDPAFNPAMALQTILNTQFGADEIEVIDLARTNLGYEVRELALAALQLEPDIGIIFGGNNWGVSSPTFADIAETDRASSREGVAGLKRSCDDYLSLRSRRVIADIAAAYKRSGLPLVWIVPEFNLADWREPSTTAPYLRGDLNHEWLLLHEQARRALRKVDYVTGEKFARRMLEIDRGVCPTSYYLLAECCRLARDFDRERNYLELARDAAAWDGSMTYTPKPNRVIQEAIREVMQEYSYQTVDLPAIFTKYLDGEIPGRRLFLDYCHLTTEGIEIAMAAAASCILRVLKGVDVPWNRLVDDHVAPSRETEAEASLLAAIHSAHRWQSYDVVRHFCSRALKFSPHVAELMLNYIELQTCNAGAPRMNEPEEQILRLGSPLIHRYILRNNERRLDEVLLRAIADALEETGIAAREHLEELRREEHSVTGRTIDLLDPFYYSSAGQPQEYEGLTWSTNHAGFHSQYYRAYWPHSRFVFIGEAGFPISLCLTCRLPQATPRERRISIEINGRREVEFEIDEQWSTWDLDIPAHDLVDGVNEIVVRWPMPEIRSEEALSKAITDLCQEVAPEFYPVFGHIYSFTASGMTHNSELSHELEVAGSQAAT